MAPKTAMYANTNAGCFVLFSVGKAACKEGVKVKKGWGGLRIKV